MAQKKSFDYRYRAMIETLFTVSLGNPQRHRYCFSFERFRRLLTVGRQLNHPLHAGDDFGRIRVDPFL